MSSTRKYVVIAGIFCISLMVLIGGESLRSGTFFALISAWSSGVYLVKKEWLTYFREEMGKLKHWRQQRAARIMRVLKWAICIALTFVTLMALNAKNERELLDETNSIKSMSNGMSYEELVELAKAMANSVE